MPNIDDLSAAYKTFINRKYPATETIVDLDKIGKEFEAAIFAFLDQMGDDAMEAATRIVKPQVETKIKLHWLTTHTTAGYVELLAVVVFEVSGCEPIQVPLESPLAIAFFKSKNIGSGHITQDLPHTILKKMSEQN